MLTVEDGLIEQIKGKKNDKEKKEALECSLKKGVFDSSDSDKENTGDRTAALPDTASRSDLSDSDPERFLRDNLKSDSEAEYLQKKNRSSNILNSESEAENVRKSLNSGSENGIAMKGTSERDSLDSSENEIVSSKKKKKKLTKKKKKLTKKKNKGPDLGELTDDEDDDLLEDLDAWLNKNEISEEPVQEKVVVACRSTDNETDGSVGMPDDTFVIKKSDDRGAVKAKKKQYKEDNPDSPEKSGEERKEKVPKKKVPKEKVPKEKVPKEKVPKEKKDLDPVALLVSERQKMLRETEFKLPRHEPAPLQLTDCLTRIPKLTALKPSPVKERKKTFIPRLSSRNDEFFLPKNLGNFMNRFKKHLALSAKVTTAVEQDHSHVHVPSSIIMKKQLQMQLKEAMLAKKREARKHAQLEKMVDEERFVDEDDAALEKMLDNDEEEEMSSEEGGLEEEQEENEDELIDRRAEKILLGEDVTSSEEEKEEKERNYHSATDSDLLASADEVHVCELPPDSASEDDALQPSRYSLRRLTRYVRKKRITKTRTKDNFAEEEDEEKTREKSEKLAKAKKKIEMLLSKRKEMKRKKEEQREKKRRIEEERRRMEEVAKKAEIAALLAEKKKAQKPEVKPAIKPAVHKPWLSDSEDDDLPEFSTDHVTDDVTDHVTSAQRPARTWYNDEALEARAARVLAGEDLSSSESEPGEPDRNYHSDTDSDFLASADEVHVCELPSDSASEDDALQPSRYSLRRLTRYCRKKRFKRRKRQEEQVSIGSESEKEEKARRKLRALLDKRDSIRKNITAKKFLGPENSYSSTLDLFSGHSRPTDPESRISSTFELPIASTVIADSLELPVSEKTFDVDTAVNNIVEDSQVIRSSNADFLAPDEDAVFLDTQGMLRSGNNTLTEGGIEALGNTQFLDNSTDMLNLCSGQFPDTAPNSGQTEGRVTLHNTTHNISFNIDGDVSRDIAYPLSRDVPKTPRAVLTEPKSHGLSQTPLTTFGKLLNEGLLSQDSDDENSRERTKGKRRALYSDWMDGEAEKSGSDHSSDEEEGADDEYDESMLAKDSELPSDEEELANQLKLAYHDQQALEEKKQLKLLKDRFIQENVGFFRTRKFHGEDSNIDLFSSNLGLDPDDEDNVGMSADDYKAAMEKRAERLKKEQFVKENQKREVLSGVDEDSQAFLDSLQDITDSNSRSAFSSSQHCGSFLKHNSSTLNRLSSITSLHADKTSNKSYVFQTVSPGQNKRRSSSQLSTSSSCKRAKKSGESSSTALNNERHKKSIFNVIK